MTTELDIRNILLVDDDPDVAESLKSLLEARNYVVTIVENGVEGLREIVRFDFDVIICDLLMPHMPGDMFYLAVQKTKPDLAQRFVFITGQSGNPKVEEFLKKIDALVLFKPVLAEDLLRMISMAVKRASATQAR